MTHITSKLRQLGSALAPITAALALSSGLNLAYAGSSENTPVAMSAEQSCPIKVGQTVPDLSLRNLKGDAVDLNALLTKQPTVLIFYRGSWCPFCNLHLGELKTIEPQLKALGFQIVAISPDTPANLQESVDKNDLSYQLLSDSKVSAAKALGLAFKVDAETQKKLTEYDIDLIKASGEKHGVLPVPAALLIDKDGVARFVFASPDYKVRVDKDVLLAAAKSMVK